MGQSLDGGDLSALAIDGEQQAGVHGPAVDDHGAGAAVADVADFLRSRQTEIVAQGVEQRAARFHQDRVPGSVHEQGDRLVGGRRRSPFIGAWRSASSED